MTTETLIALISAVGSLMGTFCGIVVSSKLTAYKIEQLEKKVEKHNTVIERQYALEEWASVYEEKMHGIDKRVETIEKNLH